MAEPQDQISGHVAKNIETIVRLEQAALDRQTFADRAATAVAKFIGSFWFVIIHLWIAFVWIVLNLKASPLRFDPYPYFLLTTIVALESMLLSTFVLISQNQMTRIAERRAHLNLQISLLAESEMTKALALLKSITDTMPGVEVDEETEQLAQPTEVEDVVRVIDEVLPPSAGGE